jgi:hypothetical protein
MIGVFDQASADARRQRVLKRVRFFLFEFAALLRGLIAEEVAKWTAGEGYVTSRCSAKPQEGASGQIADAERHLEYVLRSMEFAIAHHDFPRARYFSNEEYAARARLQQLAASHLSPQK